jgi:hypothetical protein
MEHANSLRHRPRGRSSRVGLRSTLWVCPCGGLVGFDTPYSRQPPGETRQRHFDGTHSKPRKLPENAHATKQQSHHHDPGVPAGVGLRSAPALFAEVNYTS